MRMLSLAMMDSPHLLVHYIRRSNQALEMRPYSYISKESQSKAKP